VGDSGLLCDLLWSDPSAEKAGWEPNSRGTSYTFGKDVLDRFVRRQGLDLVARAHQVVEDGYEFFANRKLVTIFSAPPTTQISAPSRPKFSLNLAPITTECKEDNLNLVTAMNYDEDDDDDDEELPMGTTPSCSTINNLQHFKDSSRDSFSASQSASQSVTSSKTNLLREQNDRLRGSLDVDSLIARLTNNNSAYHRQYFKANTTRNAAEYSQSQNAQSTSKRRRSVLSLFHSQRCAAPFRFCNRCRDCGGGVRWSG